MIGNQWVVNVCNSQTAFTGSKTTDGENSIFWLLIYQRQNMDTNIITSLSSDDRNVPLILGYLVKKENIIQYNWNFI